MKRIAVTMLLVMCMAIPFTAVAQKVGGGDIKFTPKNAGPVTFSHEAHVKDKGIKCTGCHYAIFQMAQGSYKMDMSKMTKGDFCGKCHNGHKSFDVKVTENCAKCHK
jgi:c(7)-type cytochrome triheme protein